MKGTKLTKQGYLIPKGSLSEDKKNKIIKELTVKPEFNPDYAEEPDPYEVYTENEKFYCVPRYWGINNFGPPEKMIGIQGEKKNFKFAGNLRPYQQPIVDKCLADFNMKGGGLLCLSCGMGKTAIALYLACALGLKTLVIVHKTFLQNQWYDRINQFTNAKVGLIRQKKVDVEGKDIVVGMLQSISMIDYDLDIFKDFGLVIFDEVHRSGGKVHSQAFFKTGARYTLGLTATPRRKDGMMKLIHWYLGDIMVNIKRKANTSVMVKFFHYECNDPKFKFVKMKKRGWKFRGKKNVPSIPVMQTNLCKITPRNNFLIKVIEHLMNIPERKTLILSHRLDHLNILKDGIDTIIERDIALGKLEKNEVKTGKYIGGMREMQLKISSEADIIFGSFKMAEEGLDIDSLNTIILASGQVDIEQAVGRILRKPQEECNVMPMIIDMCDNVPWPSGNKGSFAKWGDQRARYYNKNKYTVDYYRVWNEKIIDLKEWMIMKQIIKDDSEDLNLRKEYYDHLWGEGEMDEMSDDEFDPDEERMFTNKIDLESVFNASYEDDGQPGEEVKTSKLPDKGLIDAVSLKMKASEIQGIAQKFGLNIYGGVTKTGKKKVKTKSQLVNELKRLR